MVGFAQAFPQLLWSLWPTKSPALARPVRVVSTGAMVLRYPRRPEADGALEADWRGPLSDPVEGPTSSRRHGFAVPALPWWVAVFLLALLSRLGYLFLADEPPTFQHQYNYFRPGLELALRQDAWRHVLLSDAWHTWDNHWTIAPLYYLFLAAAFRLLGPHLLPLQVLQALLDAGVAVAVGALARSLAGPRGAWAGVAYALYWPSIEFPSRTYTENLHTPLLVGGAAVLSRAAATSRRGLTALAGLLLGLSALTRAVTLAFVPLAAAWLGFRRRSLLGPAVLLLAAAAPVLPWALRNLIVMGEPVPVETVAYWNLWTDNSLVDESRYERQARFLARQKTNAARRALAVRFALEGVRERPERFLEKVSDNFRHFVNLEGMKQVLRLERPDPPWRQAGSLLLDDAVLGLGLPLLVVFLLAAPRPEAPPAAGAARAVVATWAAYYLFMVVVVFHNEIRYRSAFVPFVLAAVPAGWQALAAPSAWRCWRTRLAAGAAAALLALMVAPVVVPAARALHSLPALWPARAAVAAGDRGTAEAAVLEAVRRDPASARPWLLYGRWLARAGDAGRALEAYERARMRRPRHWAPTVVAPRLLAEAGRHGEVAEAVAAAHDLSWNVDAWSPLELAWRELEAPVTDVVELGGADYGAVRDFLQPRPGHRWSRHRGEVRLRPPAGPGAYRVVVEMGSPEPSPHASPVVRVDAGRGEARFTLAREVRACELDGHTDGAGVLTVVLHAPTWNAVRMPAEQGVRVDRVAVRR